MANPAGQRHDIGCKCLSCQPPALSFSGICEYCHRPLDDHRLRIERTSKGEQVISVCPMRGEKVAR